LGAKLGQHFLTQPAILERIAAAVCPGPEPLVLEIGPGRGALTQKLLDRADRVVAIELDTTLVAHLRSQNDERLEVVAADVLATDLAQWMPAPIAGNLPYYITSPILEKVVRLPFPRAVFLIQKEVADRLTSPPGTRDYGYLTVATNLFATIKQICTVKPGAFRPPPKVDSAVVLLEPRPTAPPVPDPEAFLRFVARCFRHKRKTLRNNLPGIDSWPEASLRAEQLTLDKFVELYRRTL